MSNEVNEKSPLPLQILGWFLILGGLVFVLKIIISGSDFGFTRGIWNGLLKTLAVVAGIGFLRLRRWAVYLYFGGFTVGTASFFLIPPNDEILVLYTQPAVLVTLFVVPVLIGLFIWKHWHRLT